MPIVSLLTRCVSDADAPPRPANRAAPVAPTILRNWRLLGFVMVIPLLGSVREFLCHHDAHADGGSGSQADDTGSQRIGTLALVFEVDRHNCRTASVRE